MDNQDQDATIDNILLDYKNSIMKSFPYWLDDGRYSRMASFVKGFATPSTAVNSDQSVRKYIAKAFAV
jgi:hypothetical protein